MVPHQHGRQSSCRFRVQNRCLHESLPEAPKEMGKALMPEDIDYINPIPQYGPAIGLHTESFCTTGVIKPKQQLGLG